MEEKTQEDIALEVTKEVAKEVAKDIYSDGGKPVLQPTGELIGLIPRAIKAALEPVEKWILQREYNVAETKKLLEEKLKDIPPEFIESPEAHICVPAIQYISYCMDNDELRDMYANLLANSMNKVVKNGVHPGFVEIIKQLCPDEAKFLKYMKYNKKVPTIGLNYVKRDGGAIKVLKDFSLVPKYSGCEQINDSQKYIDNLVRLGLLQRSTLSSLKNKQLYEALKNDSYVANLNSIELAKERGYDNCEFDEGYVCLTAYGEQFCAVCLDDTQVIRVEISE